MPLFNRKKKQEVEATPEEQASMKRAEAMAANVGKEKPTDTGFNQEENNRKAQEKIQQERANPLVTIVQGAEPGKSNTQKQQTFTQEQIANSQALQNVLNNGEANAAANAIAQEGYSSAKTQEDINNVEQDVETAQDLGDIETANAQSKVLNTLGEQPGSPSYTATANAGQIQKDVNAINNSVPSAVMDKLGLQDYYPQANRDIAVGTFTGSRIGSQTIYSGAGGLLPMGLYDARKRALAEAAKEKQALVDKYDDIIETAPQYQEKFNEANADWFNQMWSKHKNNADSFLKDPEVRKEHARRLGLAKEISHYSKWSDKILEDAKKNEQYVTKEMLQNAIDIKSALVNSSDEVVSGKLDLGKLFSKANVYQNIIPQIDNVTKQVLNASNMGESPINLRTGGVYDSDKFKNEANQFVEKVKTGDINRNDFVTGFKKYFTGDYEQIIDGLIESGKYSEEQRDAALNYFAGQMQEQVKLDHKLLDSKALGWAELAQRKKEWQADYDRRIQEGKTHWQSRNEEMNFVDAKTGKSMAQIIQDYKNQGLTGSKLNNAIMETARRNGIENVTIDPYTNSVVIKELASSYENSKPKGVNNSSIWVNVKKKTIKNGKVVWMPMTIKATELPHVDLGKVKLLFQDGTPINKEVQSQYKEAIKNNKLSMRVNSYDLSYGYADAKKNDIVTVNPESISGYSPDKMVFLKKSVGKISQVSKDKDGNDVYTSLPGTVFVKNEFSSNTGINSNDELWGQGIKSESGFGLGQGPVVESRSYSSSSEEE